jgi:CMP-N,N'-diacetyllegionaminic acid synthase
LINSKKNIVAIILARGGSKGLPKKNILPVNGKPLIAYSIEAAKKSKYVNRVIVSTDDKEIAKIALSNDAEVPFLRPNNLANDTATSEVALKHAVEWLRDNENYQVDIVVYLQTTDLFRTKTMIDDCVEVLLSKPEVDSAFMGLEVHKNFWRKDNGNFVRLADDIPYGIPRQEREPLYREDTGLALATRSSVILAGNRVGENIYIIPYEQKVDFIDIHTEFEKWLSEILITDGKILPNE